MARILAAVLLCSVYMSQVKSQEAILHLSDGTSDKEYCVAYNSLWTNLSESLGGANEYVLVNLMSSVLCNSSGLSPGTLNGKAVVVMRGECEFIQKAIIAQELGAAAILIASEKPVVIPSANQSDYLKVKIPLVLMRYEDILDAQETFPGGMTVRLYAPAVPLFDVSILVMLAIAVFTVAAGGYWSGASEREKLSTTLATGGGGGGGRADSGDLAVYSPVKVIVFVAFMCVMLVLMYFFYKWLVYVIIAVFCLASAVALHTCLDILLEKIGFGNGSFSCQGNTFSVRSLLLAAVCITVAVLWGVYRNEDRWVWILQDLLGIAFCINFMKSITVSNYKICVILLGLLLLYDVFFVFITPFLTPNGESIMVQVALGSDSTGEKLPVVMRVPRFSVSTLNPCGVQFSILGYGDLIVPGLLVSYCHRFDVWTNSPRKIYYICCTIAYLMGMIVTFAVMILSRMGQPALLYLVPFTLLTSAIVAYWRGEMRSFWSGTRTGYQVLDSSREPLLQGVLCPPPRVTEVAISLPSPSPSPSSIFLIVLILHTFPIDLQTFQHLSCVTIPAFPKNKS
ncbi:signal peptide peptidase-like 2A isoform X2 [Megalops cyprinoides]|uniref:signal peptide peptidase-like 2A isoform X2 n=1 Tax=Megalops cyprinoides TaxID=118141 RepID=UPI00186474A7|nr:signal peptide peptidase-like 2A isoform X2 [Megalops cyprinoides]